MTKKETAQLIVTGLMIAILIFILVKGFRKGIQNAQDLRRRTLQSSVLTEKPGGTQDTGAQAASQTAPAAAGQTSYARLEAISDSIVLKRDPFSNVPVFTQAKVSAGGTSLSGILWDGIKPMAVINGKIVKAGDSVDNNTVVSIKKDRVILNNGTKDYELKLGE